MSASTGAQIIVRPRLGVSSCLLGERVRYDGGHKRDRFLIETLGRFVDWVPVCPEVECGLPTPREAMRLVGDPAAPRLVTVRSGRDLTAQMQAWIRTKLPALERLELAGFVFKSRSPSSGMERVRVYASNAKRAAVAGSSSGLFAQAFMKRFPLLPVEEDDRLRNTDLRENFVERILCLQGYRDGLQNRRPSDRAEAAPPCLTRTHKI